MSQHRFFALAVIVGFSPNSYKDVINRHVYVFLFTKNGGITGNFKVLDLLRK